MYSWINIAGPRRVFNRRCIFIYFRVQKILTWAQQHIICPGSDCAVLTWKQIYGWVKLSINVIYCLVPHAISTDRCLDISQHIAGSSFYIDSLRYSQIDQTAAQTFDYHRLPLRVCPTYWGGYLRDKSRHWTKLRVGTATSLVDDFYMHICRHLWVCSRYRT